MSSLSSKYGGAALRKTNTFIATATTSAAHKITKKIWNDLNLKTLYLTNDYFKKKSLKVIDQYNKLVNNKHSITIDGLYDDYNVINDKSLLGKDIIVDEMKMKEQINDFENVCITNNVKTK